MVIQGHSYSLIAPLLPRPKLSAFHEENDSLVGWLLMTVGCCPFPESEGSCPAEFLPDREMNKQLSQIETSISASPPWACPLTRSHTTSTAQDEARLDGEKARKVSWVFTKLLSSPKWSPERLEERRGAFLVPPCQVDDTQRVTSEESEL